MANDVKERVLGEVKKRFPSCMKMQGSQSLYDLGNGARLYIRYSKLHPGNRTFYGLRKADLQQLDGHPSLICFLWDTQVDPLFVPYADFEDVFTNLNPANDGQYKAQVYVESEATELYIANAGRFNVEGYFGWNETNNVIPSTTREQWNAELTHSQIQTLLGSIGVKKGHDVWVPSNDRGRLDWSITQRFPIRTGFPETIRGVSEVADEIDVIWLNRGSGRISALFEVEHSTPVYSGLLRFNDVRLLWPEPQPRFSIIANDSRRSLFTRQINRPTFRASGLDQACTFLDYASVYEWHKRLGSIIAP